MTSQSALWSSAQGCSNSLKSVVSVVWTNTGVEFEQSLAEMLPGEPLEKLVQLCRSTKHQPPLARVRNPLAGGDSCLPHLNRSA